MAPMELVVYIETHRLSNARGTIVTDENIFCMKKRETFVSRKIKYIQFRVYVSSTNKHMEFSLQFEL